MAVDVYGVFCPFILWFCCKTRADGLYSSDYMPHFRVFSSSTERWSYIAFLSETWQSKSSISIFNPSFSLHYDVYLMHLSISVAASGLTFLRLHCSVFPRGPCCAEVVSHLDLDTSHLMISLVSKLQPKQRLHSLNTLFGMCEIAPLFLFFFSQKAYLQSYFIRVCRYFIIIFVEVMLLLSIIYICILYICITGSVQ